MELNGVNDSLRVALEFELDSNTKYPIPGYNVYNIVREDSIPGQAELQSSLHFTHVITVSYDSAHNALSTNDSSSSSFSYSKKQTTGSKATKETTSNKAVQIAPNPFQDEITISWDSEQKGEEALDITVFDMSGQIVEQRKALNHTSEHIIKTALWSKGIYLIQIRQGRQIMETQKMVKQ